MNTSIGVATIDLTRMSLRTLLLVVTVIGIWLGFRVNEVRQQRAAIEQLSKIGATIYYDYQESEKGSNGERSFNPKSAGSQIQRLMGQIYSPSVRVVLLKGTTATDDHVALLKRFPKIMEIGLGNTSVSDKCIHELSGLRNLEGLFLDGTLVTDEGMADVGRMTNLKSLTLPSSITDAGVMKLSALNLRQLSLWKCRSITDDGAAHLAKMTSLRNLVLDETGITDRSLEWIGKLTNLEQWLGLTKTVVTDDGIQKLSALTKLKSLNLKGTNTTIEGVRRLQKALPKADISFY